MVAACSQHPQWSASPTLPTVGAVGWPPTGSSHGGPRLRWPPRQGDGQWLRSKTKKMGYRCRRPPPPLTSAEGGGGWPRCPKGPRRSFSPVAATVTRGTQGLGITGKRNKIRSLPNLPLTFRLLDSLRWFGSGFDLGYGSRYEDPLWTSVKTRIWIH